MLWLEKKTEHEGEVAMVEDIVLKIAILDGAVLGLLKSRKLVVRVKQPWLKMPC